MQEFFKKLEPVDVIAVVAVCGGFVLMSLHIDTVVGGLITLITAYYFGHKRKIENGVK